MNRRQFVRSSVAIAGLGVFAGCGTLPSGNRNGDTVRRIGFLLGTPASAEQSRTDAFRQGLRELGYEEGRDIVIEWRSADGQFDRLPGLASELVQLGVAVVVAGGPRSTQAAKAAITTTTVVMTQDSDPVGSGVIASLAGPGANITGLTTLSTELSGKRLELLQAIVPGLSRVAVIGSLTAAGAAQVLRETELAAGASGVQVRFLDGRGPDGIQPRRHASRDPDSASGRRTRYRPAQWC